MHHRSCGICFDQFNLHPRNTASSSKQAQSSGLFLRCNHGYCHACFAEHVRVKINAPTAPFPPTCPEINCDTVIDKQLTIGLLSAKDQERWNQRAVEIQIRNKVYCPNKTCSNLHDGDRLLPDQFGACRCTKCGSRFCKDCKVRFHEGLSCNQYLALPEGERDIEDRQAIQLAEEEAWRRCPSCRAIVELDYGCNHITCHCKYEL